MLALEERGPRDARTLGPGADRSYGRPVTARYRTQPQVHFAAFKTLEKRRVEAGNAIWAILAGSQIAANTLVLTEGSQRTLSEIFPSVGHIRRFDLRSDRARELLGTAEADLSTMAMSYAIALHGDFAKTCLSWLIPLGLVTRPQWRDARTVNVHERLESATGRSMQADSLALFHYTRVIRNCHIHAGGRASAELARQSANLSFEQQRIWSDLTGEPFTPISEGDPAAVGVGGLVATLAVGKRLSYEINLCLQLAIPRTVWADMAAEEYFSTHPRKSPRDPTACRSVRGYIRGRFDALQLSESELQDAIARRL
jgi:hypothetical protein